MLGDYKEMKLNVSMWDFINSLLISGYSLEEIEKQFINTIKIKNEMELKLNDGK